MYHTQQAWQAATGLPAPLPGCTTCQANPYQYCECGVYLPPLTKPQALAALHYAHDNQHLCMACSDACPPNLGCDHPMGCGQWQDWLSQAGLPLSQGDDGDERTPWPPS